MSFKIGETYRVLPIACMVAKDYIGQAVVVCELVDQSNDVVYVHACSESIDNMFLVTSIEVEPIILILDVDSLTNIHLQLQRIQNL